MKRHRVLARMTRTGRISLFALALLLLFPLLASAAQDRTYRAPKRNVEPSAPRHVLDLLSASPLESPRQGLDENFSAFRLARFLIKPSSRPGSDGSALEHFSGSTEYGFQGREKDSESGLQFFRARSYDPTTGRFASRDPIPYPNLYHFCANDPVNKTDPSGRFVTFLDDSMSEPEKAAYLDALGEWLGYEFELSGGLVTPRLNSRGGAIRHKDLDNGNLPDWFRGWMGEKGAGSMHYVEDAVDMIMNENPNASEFATLLMEKKQAHGVHIDVSKEMANAANEREAAGFAAAAELVGIFQTARGIVTLICVIGDAVTSEVGGGALALESGGGSTALATSRVVAVDLPMAMASIYQIGSGMTLYFSANSVEGGGGEGPVKQGRLGPNWRPRSVNDPAFRSNCDACARNIKRMIKGEIKKIKPPYGASLRMTGGPQWPWHEVVVKDGRVFDAFTGSLGKTIEEYQAMWEYPELIGSYLR